MMQPKTDKQMKKIILHRDGELSDSDISSACKAAIAQMFLSTYFNASTVWECCELLEIGFMAGTQVGKFVNLYHCVDFIEIEPKQLKKLQTICFRLVGLQIDGAEKIELIEPDYHDFELAPCQY